MKHESIKPLRDKIIVLQTEADEATKGGIIIPELAREKPKHGTVVAVGPGKKNAKGILEPTQVKVGDKVYFGKHANIEIMHEGKEHFMMNEANVLLIEN